MGVEKNFCMVHKDSKDGGGGRNPSLVPFLLPVARDLGV